MFILGVHVGLWPCPPLLLRGQQNRGGLCLNMFVCVARAKVGTASPWHSRVTSAHSVSFRRKTVRRRLDPSCPALLISFLYLLWGRAADQPAARLCTNRPWGVQSGRDGSTRLGSCGSRRGRSGVEPRRHRAHRTKHFLISSQEKRPAEFKHINKRRKRN